MDQTYLETRLHTVDDKVKFNATSGTNPEIVIDYFPPIGTGEGYTSLELLMISFSSCIGSVVLTLLRARMRRQIDSLSVHAKGLVREQHPKALSHLQLELVFVSQDAEETDVQKAIALAEEKLCPVWAMLKGNVEVSVSFVVNRQTKA